MKTVRHSPNPSKSRRASGGMSMMREYPDVVEQAASPSPDEIQRFVKTAERYGYWLATPEENAYH